MGLVRSPQNIRCPL